MKFTTLTAGVTLTFLLATDAHASPIFYESVNEGGDNWRYDYTVGNDTPFDIEQFTIYFDFGLYEFALIESPEGSREFVVDPDTYTGPPDWDVFVAPPDDFFGLLDDGFYDAFAEVDPISPGDDLLSGFSTSFTYLGPGAPGPQSFDFFGVDSQGNEVGGSAVTQLNGTVAQVPEPPSIALLIGGLLLLTHRRLGPGR